MLMYIVKAGLRKEGINFLLNAHVHIAVLIYVLIMSTCPSLLRWHLASSREIFEECAFQHWFL